MHESSACARGIYVGDNMRMECVLCPWVGEIPESVSELGWGNLQNNVESWTSGTGKSQE